MSSRSWLSYYYQNRFHLTPLSYESLAYASGFSSEQCPEGVVAISENTLRILALEKLGAVFNQVGGQAGGLLWLGGGALWLGGGTLWLGGHIGSAPNYYICPICS